MGREARTSEADLQTSGINRTGVYDRYGRELRPNDIVMFPQTGDVAWRVQGTRPVLRPDAPPGLVEITFVSVTVVGVAGGRPWADVVKVRDASELSPQEAGNATNNDQKLVQP